MALGASLTGIFVLGGDIAPDVEFAAEPHFGPLWESLTECPVSEWDESALCPAAAMGPYRTAELGSACGAPDPRGYGMGMYGRGRYNAFETPWEPSDSAPPATWAAGFARD